MRRLLQMINYVMEDTLRFMIEDAVEKFAAFIEAAAAGDIEIQGPREVVRTQPGTAAPIFSLELLAMGSAGAENAGASGGITYAAPNLPEAYLAAVLECFDSALSSPSLIPQVEQQIMPHLLKNVIVHLQTVSSNESKCVAARVRIETEIRRWFEPVQTYLQTYEKYQSFVQKTIAQYITELSGEETTLAIIRTEIEYHTARADAVLDELPRTIRIGLFDVTVTQVRAFISRKHSETVQALQDLVLAQCNEKCNAICEEMQGMCTRVQKPVGSPEHAQEQRQYFKEVEASVSAMQPRIDEIPAYYELLESFYFLLSDEADRIKWATFTWPLKMAEAIEEGMANCEAAENMFQNMMLGEQKQFESEIVALNNIVAGYGKHTDLGQLEKLATDTKKCKLRLTDLEKKAKTFNAHEAIFGIEQTDYSHISKIIKEFDPFVKMWATADTFTTHHELWMTGSFLELDAEAIEKEVTESYKLLTKTAKQLGAREDGAGCQKICEDVKEKMDEFKPLLPMLIALRNPGMRDRHWEKLSEDIGQRLNPDKHFKLETCVQMDLMSHIKDIEKVGEISGKEYTLETALTGMYSQWEGVLLDITDYRDTGTFILRGSEETIQQLDDQITMTQAISFSPFKGVFEQDITDWDKKLNTVSEVMDEWLACQRNWMYLEPIFSSDDIKKQLPVEATRFSTVDQKWRKNMANAVKNPGVVDFCANERLLIDFQVTNS